jgi:MFS family permease
MLHRRATGQRYAFVVIAVTFVTLLVAAALRSAPSVLILPLEAHFGWDRATVSASAAIGIVLYGLVGPFAAALMQSFGIRRTMICGLALMSVATFLSLWMTKPWHYVLTWGVLSGIGSARSPR